MKFTKSMAKKREAVVRKFLGEKPEASNKDVQKYVKKETGHGMGSGTITDIRRRASRKPPKDSTDTAPKTSDVATGVVTPTVETALDRPTGLDNTKLMVVIGTTEAVGDMLRRVFSKEG